MFPEDRPEFLQYLWHALRRVPRLQHNWSAWDLFDGNETRGKTAVQIANVRGQSVPHTTRTPLEAQDYCGILVNLDLMKIKLQSFSSDSGQSP
jgi:hypothetical protein